MNQNATNIAALVLIAILAIVVIRLGAADSPAKSGGIQALPAKTDAGTPGIEYREVKINGMVYTATRGKYWPGGAQEKWDLVGPK